MTVEAFVVRDGGSVATFEVVGDASEVAALGEQIAEKAEAVIR